MNLEQMNGHGDCAERSFVMKGTQAARWVESGKSASAASGAGPRLLEQDRNVHQWLWIAENALSKHSILIEQALMD